MNKFSGIKKLILKGNQTTLQEPKIKFIPKNNSMINQKNVFAAVSKSLFEEFLRWKLIIQHQAF